VQVQSTGGVFTPSRCASTDDAARTHGTNALVNDRPARRSLFRLVVLFVVTSLATISVSGQAHPATPHEHPEARKLEPAVAGTPQAIEAGRGLYGKLCASCHGPNGLGNGRLAAGVSAYGPRPSDLTDDVWQHGASAGEIYVVIRDGLEPDFHMPAFGGKVSENDLWNVTHFVKSLSQ
jgi:mono/diheme cytochrome c family protein